MRPSQERTNFLGCDAGSSRKIPDGAIALACSAPTERLEAANSMNAYTLVALTLFRFLCIAYGAVKAVLKVTAAGVLKVTEAVFAIREEAQGNAYAPTFQIQVKVDGATVMLDAGSAWTAADVKAALHAKTGRATRVLIVGYTDTSGSAAYNLGLSNRRSRTVADALVAQGVNGGVIALDGKGETNLAKATADGVREPLNRRATIDINF